MKTMEHVAVIGWRSSVWLLPAWPELSYTGPETLSGPCIGPSTVWSSQPPHPAKPKRTLPGHVDVTVVENNAWSPVEKSRV